MLSYIPSKSDRVISECYIYIYVHFYVQENGHRYVHNRAFFSTVNYFPGPFYVSWLFTKTIEYFFLAFYTQKKNNQTPLINE